MTQLKFWDRDGVTGPNLPLPNRYGPPRKSPRPKLTRVRSVDPARVPAPRLGSSLACNSHERCGSKQPLDPVPYLGPLPEGCRPPDQLINHISTSGKASPIPRYGLGGLSVLTFRESGKEKFGWIDEISGFIASRPCSWPHRLTLCPVLRRFRCRVQTDV